MTTFLGHGRVFQAVGEDHRVDHRSFGRHVPAAPVSAQNIETPQPEVYRRRRATNGFTHRLLPRRRP
jgi:hypothetical protein